MNLLNYSLDGQGLFPSMPNTVYKLWFALWLVDSRQQPRDQSIISMDVYIDVYRELFISVQPYYD